MFEKEFEDELDFKIFGNQKLEDWEVLLNSNPLFFDASTSNLVQLFAFRGHIINSQSCCYLIFEYSFHKASGVC